MSLTQQQIATRESGIGSSDCAAAIGVSPYKTRYELWLEKTGQATAPDLDEVERVQWGNHLEPIIAERYAAREGVKVARVNQTQVHPEIPYLLSHIDRRVVGKDMILECKNASEYYGSKAFGEEYSDQVPENYLVQVTHQLIVNRKQLGDLAALIGGNRLRIYRIHLDDELANLIVDRCRYFWNCVVTNRAPDPLEVAELELMYAQDSGQMKTVDASVFAIWQRYHELQEAHKKFSDEINSVKDQLRFAIAEAAGIQLSNELEGPQAPAIEYAGMPLATWRSQTSRRFDVTAFKNDHPQLAENYLKPSTTRVLRVKG
jgi:putative phage-type endonuclease